MSTQKQTPEPDPNDPELIMLDRILSKTADFIFPLTEEEITATDKDVARLMKAIRPAEQKTQPDLVPAQSIWQSILLFPERMLAAAASLFYAAGGGLLYSLLQRPIYATATFAGTSSDQNNTLLGYSAKVTATAGDAPPQWLYVLSGLLLIIATGLLFWGITKYRSKQNKKSDRGSHHI
jgi:hypothetical protein